MKVELTLSASGADPVHADAELHLLSAGARLVRVIVVLVVAVVLAALIVPVPIVHLVGIPLILLVGIVVAVRVGRRVARLAPLKVACPRCGGINTIGGGLGLRNATDPIALDCESCRRALQLSIAMPPTGPSSPR